MESPTRISHFLALLTSKLTQYDARVSVRQPNVYRLGHLLGAAEKVAACFPHPEAEATPDRIAPMVGAIERHFILPFPPADAVIRQIKAYLATGKRPSLVRA